MRYLGLALYAEGSTDYYFLRPLLQRLCEDICTLESAHLVEVSEVTALDHPAVSNEAPREERILAAAKEARGSWNVIFVHADGSGDSDRVRGQQVQPAIGLIQRDLAQEGMGVAVIPIRETEAWAICDGDAVRHVFGTTLSDEDLELPRLPTMVEADLDPKARLLKAFLNTKPSGRHKKLGVSPMLNALGEQVSLPQLRRLTGFVVLETELKAALRQLQIL